jgi:hypothetical protein
MQKAASLMSGIRMRLETKAGASFGAKELGDASEMMIVVLRYKVEQVRDAHGRVQARVKRGPAEVFGRLRFQSRHEREAPPPEFAQDFFRRPAVVVRLMRFLIQQVRDA